MTQPAGVVYNLELERLMNTKQQMTKSIHLFLDSSDSESVQDDEDISCFVFLWFCCLVYTLVGMCATMAGRRLAFSSPASTPLVERDQLPASPQTDHKKLLVAISGLSRQLSRVATDMNEQFSAVNSRLLSIEDRLVALESKNCAGEANSKKRRRVHNPKIAEAIRQLHNSETNTRRYDPEQGLNSPHNEAVTSYLLGAMSASPDLHDADDEIVSACKTYYESIRRSFRYNQPGLAEQVEAAKISARRRKRLLEARWSVLAADEVELWKSATVDLMSNEEDGTVGGVSGWIVRSPSVARTSPNSVLRCSRDWRGLEVQSDPP
ncbi:uncharacterized protein PAE49_004230 [Odontesthes bonariensis]